MATPIGYTKVGTIAYSDKGAYNSFATYNKYNVVVYNGSSWVCKQDGVTGIIPVEGDNWHLMARGFILVIDPIPQAGSTNPVESGGVYTELSNLNASKQTKFRYVLPLQELATTDFDENTKRAQILNTDITSATRAEVYFTDACIAEARKAKIDVYTDTGRIVFQAKKIPSTTLVCDIIYDKEYVAPTP